MLFKLLLAMIGGALGSGARYYVGVLSSRAWPDHPHAATLIVNVAGCFVIGLCVPAFLPSPSMPTRIFLVTGILGGFTTFSAFGLETYTLFQRSQPIWALANIAANVILGLGAVGLGIRAGRVFGA